MFKVTEKTPKSHKITENDQITQIYNKLGVCRLADFSSTELNPLQTDTTFFILFLTLFYFSYPIPIEFCSISTIYVLINIRKSSNHQKKIFLKGERFHE